MRAAVPSLHGMGGEAVTHPAAVDISRPGERPSLHREQLVVAGNGDGKRGQARLELLYGLESRDPGYVGIRARQSSVLPWFGRMGSHCP